MTYAPLRPLTRLQEAQRKLNPWGWTSRSGPVLHSLVGRTVSWLDGHTRRVGIALSDPQAVRGTIKLVNVAVAGSTRSEFIALSRLEIQPYRSPAPRPPLTSDERDALEAFNNPAPAVAPQKPQEEREESTSSATRTRKSKPKSPEARERFNAARRAKRAAAKAAKEGQQP